MIKKLFLCAALVGAVGLTSCVDDVESASTQAVRQAKAAQLKAKGDLEKANAQAQLILSNAEQQAAETALAAKQAQAELDKAEAAYQLALTAYKQAEADAVKAQTEKEKELAAIALEEAKVQLEQDQIALEQSKVELQEKQSNLAKWIAQYEKDLAEAEYEAEIQRQALQDLINKAEADEYVRLQSLVIKYYTEYSTLTELQKSLNNENLTLAKLEAGVIDATAAAKRDIKSAEKKISDLNKQIDDAKAAIAALQTSDVQTATQKYEELKAESVRLNQDVKAAMQAKTEAQYANLDAQAAITGSKYMTAIESLKISAYNGYRIVTDYTNDPALPNNVKGKWYVEYSVLDASNNTITKYIPLFTDGSESSETYSEKYSEYGYGPYTALANYDEYSTPYFKAEPAGCDEFAKLLDADIAKLEKTAQQYGDSLTKYSKLQTKLEDAQTKYAAAKNNNTGLKPNQANASELQAAQKKAAQDLLKVINEVNKAIAAANQTAWTEIKWDEVTYADDFNDKDKLYLPAQKKIDSKVRDWTRDKNMADYNLSSNQTNAEAIKANLTTISTGSSDFATLVANANEASKAYAIAQVKYTVADGKKATTEQLMYAYGQVIIDNEGTTANQITQKIEELNANIAKWELEIEQQNTLIEKYNNDLAAGTLENEALLEVVNAEIEKLKGQIAAQQAVVDAAKAALDAALAAE